MAGAIEEVTTRYWLLPRSSLCLFANYCFDCFDFYYFTALFLLTLLILACSSTIIRTI